MAQSQSISYEEDLERVKREIWSSIDVKGLLVVDFGVGESTRTLVEMGAHVIGVDVDGNGLREQRGVVPHLVRCYLPHLPFRPGSIDLAVFYFTLHEVDPSLHLDVGWPEK